MAQPYRDGQSERRFFVGTNCHVLCIDQDDGKIVWETPLRSSVSSTLVSLLLDQGRIYAANWRQIACIQASDGKLLWATELNRLAEPASLALDPTVPGGQLLVGSGGWLFALSADHGAVQWENDLPGLGYHPICMRVPGAVVAQPTVRYVTHGKSRVPQVLESEQGGEV